MAFSGRDTGGPLKKMWLLFGLILLCCTFPSPSGATFSTLKSEVTGGKELECYVCSSVVGDCDNKIIKKCKVDSGDDSYLETVYGSLSMTDSTELKMWPPSHTSLAAKATNGTAKPKEYGWTYAVFPGAFQQKPPTAATADKVFKVSSLSLARKEDSARFTKGFQSCREMKIWADSQKNDGKTQEIPSSKPRIVRTCSFLPVPKGEKDKAYENGCRTINFKTATVSVCYCDKNEKDSKKPCNTSTRLQVSTIAVFLIASLLCIVGSL